MKRIINIIFALTVISFSAGAQSNVQTNNAPSLQKSLDWIKTHIVEVSSGEYTYKQLFEFDAKMLWRIKYTSTKGGKSASTEYVYEFNLADLNEASVDYKVIQTTITLSLLTRDGKKAIKYSKNGKMQSYTSSLEIIVKDVENANDLVNAFKHVIVLARESQKEWYQKE